MQDLKFRKNVYRQFALFALIVLVIIAFVLVLQTERDQTAVSTGTITLDGEKVTTTTNPQSEVSMSDYTTTEIRDKLSFKYPVDAEVNEIDDQIKIVYMGLDNTLDSIITDGYEVTVVVHKDTTVTDYLQSRESASAVQPIQVSGRDGYTYITNPVLGEQLEEHVIFSEETGLVIEATYVVAGESKATYRERVWSILTSIKLAEESADL